MGRGFSSVFTCSTDKLPIDTWYQTFLFASFDIFLSSFYESTAKVGSEKPQILEVKCHKYWKQKLELL